MNYLGHKVNMSPHLGQISMSRISFSSESVFCQGKPLRVGMDFCLPLLPSLPTHNELCLFFSTSKKQTERKDFSGRL